MVVMLLLPPLCLLFAHVRLVSSYGREEICYGGSYDVPIYYTPPLFPTTIYYKPRGKEQILAVNQGKSVHKRFLVQTGSITLRDLTEQDDDAMLFFGLPEKGRVRLHIKDCKYPEKSYYGDMFTWLVPPNAEYMEFSQMTTSGRYLTPIVIWNRTDASSVMRGRVKKNLFDIDSVKQKDSGYYKCLDSKGELIKWKRLEVKEHFVNFDRMVDADLDVNFPVKFSTLPHIKFTSQQSGFKNTIEIYNTDPRIELTKSYFRFMYLKDEDAGTYQFIDDDGDLALEMSLHVHYPELSGWVYIVAAVIIVFFLVCCCCCVKKCCCKRNSTKRSSLETDAAAPPVISNDTTQPPQSVVPVLSREPRVIHVAPPSYDSAVGNVDLTPSTQITVPGELEPTSTPLMSNSSDSDPKFALKGSVFPSAPPLSSGTDIQDVYSSDKLNFL